MPHAEGLAVFTMMLSVPVCESAGVLASVTCTEKLVLPVFVGVPLIAPEEARESPAGRELPLTRLKLYGGTPPVAVTVAE